MPEILKVQGSIGWNGSNLFDLPPFTVGITKKYFLLDVETRKGVAAKIDHFVTYVRSQRLAEP